MKTCITLTVLKIKNNKLCNYAARISLRTLCRPNANVGSSRDDGYAETPLALATSSTSASQLCYDQGVL